MGNIDVSSLLIDVDFTNTVTLVTRSASVNSDGLNVMSETQVDIDVVVTNLGKNQLEALPEGVRVTDAIAVYYRGEIRNEVLGGYADVIVFNGQRYKAVSQLENWMHMGVGFTATLCVREALYA